MYQTQHNTQNIDYNISIMFMLSNIYNRCRQNRLMLINDDELVCNHCNKKNNISLSDRGKVLSFMICINPLCSISFCCDCIKKNNNTQSIIECDNCHKIYCGKCDLYGFRDGFSSCKECFSDRRMIKTIKDQEINHHQQSPLSTKKPFYKQRVLETTKKKMKKRVNHRKKKQRTNRVNKREILLLKKRTEKKVIIVID